MTVCEAPCPAHEQSANSSSICVPLVHVAACGPSWERRVRSPQAGRASVPLLPVQLSSLAHQLL